MRLFLCWLLFLHCMLLLFFCWSKRCPAAFSPHCQMMSGLCPPVPTELVSVFNLKTGSVQQEQEWSPCTSNLCHVPPHQLTASETARQRDSRAQIWHFGCRVQLTTPRAAWDVGFQPLAVLKVKRRPLATCQTTAVNLEVYAKRSSSSLIAAPVFDQIWMFHKQIYHFLVL